MRLKYFAKNSGIFLATAVVILTLLFQSGLINYVTHDYPWSFSLDFDRKSESTNFFVVYELHNLYLMDQEVVSAQWLERSMNHSSNVYSDFTSQTSILMAYTTVWYRNLVIENHTLDSSSYVYLRYVNTQMGLIGSYNSSEMSPILDGCSQIYSNKISDIRLSP